MVLRVPVLLVELGSAEMVSKKMKWRRKKRAVNESAGGGVFYISL